MKNIGSIYTTKTSSSFRRLDEYGPKLVRQELDRNILLQFKSNHHEKMKFNRYGDGDCAWVGDGKCVRFSVFIFL